MRERQGIRGKGAVRPSGGAANEGQRLPVSDVYLLVLHEPYEAAGHPVPINATIVHARSLLHRAVPQPDGGRVYRCLTEFPGRVPGDVVPLSTLTFELDGGALWPLIGDWEDVVQALARLARSQQCDAVHLGLPEVTVALMRGGPTTVTTVYYPDGTRSRIGPAERQQRLAELTAQVRGFAAEGPFWPGDHLLPPPTTPRTMPYKPYRL